MLHFGKTHLGNRKPENQDYIAWNEAINRFVVADGMSGLAKGALAMSRKKVIVKRLNSIQNIGAMNVLCTDKTGTLTQDRIDVRLV